MRGNSETANKGGVGIRLIVDADVSDLPGGPEGLRAARDVARRAIDDGAEYVEIYEGVGERWDLIASLKQKEPKRFFREAARDVARGADVTALRLPARDHAAHLLDSVLRAPRGRDEINILTANLKPGECRREDIRGVFVIDIRADSAGRVRYTVEGNASKRDLLQSIYAQAGAGEPDRIATTPHHVYRPAGRQRGMNRK